MLVNIFAGINRCDWVAQGVVQAAKRAQARRPPGRPARGHERRGGPQDPEGQRPRPGHRGYPHRGGREGRRRPQGLGQHGRKRKAMSILIDEKTRVIIQGFTGDKATFHGKEMIAYGTNLVGGVTPGQGRQAPPRPAGLQHRQGSRPRDRRRGDHHLRTGRLLRRLDHGSGRRRHPAGLRHHRRDPGAGHDDGEALSVALSQGEALDGDRPQLRRHHQPGQGHARHHAGPHLQARHGGSGDALRARWATRPRRR